MITYNTIPCFYKGINLKNTCLSDNALLNKEYPINKSTFIMLSTVNGKRTVGECNEIIKDYFPKVDVKILQNDFETLLSSMVRNQLIYLSSSPKEKISRILFAIITPGGNANLYKRHFVKSKSFWVISAFLNIVVLKKMLPILILFMVTALIPMVYTNNLDLFIWPLSICLFLLFFLMSIATHEASHLYVIRRKYKNDSIGYIKEELLTLKIIRPSMEDDLLVIASGPLFTATIGNLFLWASLFIVDPFWHIVIQLCAGVFLMHLLYLLPFMGDGKSFIKKLKLLERNGQYENIY